MLESSQLIKIYSIKNHAFSFIGLFLLILLSFFFIHEIQRIPSLDTFALFPFFQQLEQFSHFKLFIFFAGVIIMLFAFFISYFPNVVITEKQLKIGWKFGGIIGLTYRHQIPWEKITQIDSGGSKLLQWSPNTSVFYHTGKTPIGHSSDLVEAVISRHLGYHNYCKILNIVLQKARHAKVDHLTLDLIKNSDKIPAL